MTWYNEEAITALAVLADRWARYLPVSPSMARVCGWLIPTS